MRTGTLDSRPWWLVGFRKSWSHWNHNKDELGNPRIISFSRPFNLGSFVGKSETPFIEWNVRIKRNYTSSVFNLEQRTFMWFTTSKLFFWRFEIWWRQLFLLWRDWSLIPSSNIATDPTPSPEMNKDNDDGSEDDKDDVNENERIVQFILQVFPTESRQRRM